MLVKAVLESAEFSKLIKKNRAKDKIIKGCKNTLLSFKFSNNPPTTFLLHDCKICQIWKFRIPNPNANKGLSAGLRLFAYFKKENSTFYLYKIYQKNEVDKISNIEQSIKDEILKIFLKF
jgi:mRNA-degrading endonuclease RelE of RelBE toxin-antitoxin system